MESDFVAGVADQGAFLGEGLQGMARDEPGCFHVVLFEELEEPAYADGASEHAWALLSGMVWGGIGRVPRLMSLEESSPP